MRVAHGQDVLGLDDAGDVPPDDLGELDASADGGLHDPCLLAERDEQALGAWQREQAVGDRRELVLPSGTPSHQGSPPAGRSSTRSSGPSSSVHVGRRVEHRRHHSSRTSHSADQWPASSTPSGPA